MSLTTEKGSNALVKNGTFVVLERETDIDHRTPGRPSEQKRITEPERGQPRRLPKARTPKHRPGYGREAARKKSKKGDGGGKGGTDRGASDARSP